MSDGEKVALRVRLFGALRQWAPEGELTLSSPAGAGAAEVRRLLGEAMVARGAAAECRALLERSALADESRLLGVGWTVPAIGCEVLAVLPPVCGG